MGTEKKKLRIKWTSGCCATVSRPTWTRKRNYRRNERWWRQPPAEIKYEQTVNSWAAGVKQFGWATCLLLKGWNSRKDSVVLSWHQRKRYYRWTQQHGPYHQTRSWTSQINSVLQATQKAQCTKNYLHAKLWSRWSSWLNWNSAQGNQWRETILWRHHEKSPGWKGVLWKWAKGFVHGH